MVNVSSHTLVEKRGEVLETEHVYDALENVVLGGKITTRALARSFLRRTEGTGHRDDPGRQILGKDDIDAAREAFQWFWTLMTD
jgi:hypothetical protein